MTKCDIMYVFMYLCIINHSIIGCITQYTVFEIIMKVKMRFVIVINHVCSTLPMQL